MSDSPSKWQSWLRPALYVVGGLVIGLAVICVALTLLGPTLSTEPAVDLTNEGQCAAAMAELPGTPDLSLPDVTWTVWPGGTALTVDNIGRMQELQPLYMDYNLLAQPPLGKTLTFTSATTMVMVSGEEDWSNLLATLSPDGRTLALIDRFNRARSYAALRLCDAHTGGQLAAFAIDETATAVAFTADGAKLLLNEGHGTTIRVFDAEAGSFRESAQWEVQVPDDPVHRTRHLAISPNGQLAAFTVDAIGGENSVRIWDIEAGEELASLRGHEDSGGIFSVAFDPTGSWLVFGNTDGTIHVWGLP